MAKVKGNPPGARPGWFHFLLGFLLRHSYCSGVRSVLARDDEMVPTVLVVTSINGDKAEMVNGARSGLNSDRQAVKDAIPEFQLVQKLQCDTV